MTGSPSTVTLTSASPTSPETWKSNGFSSPSPLSIDTVPSKTPSTSPSSTRSNCVDPPGSSTVGRKVPAL